MKGTFALSIRLTGQCRVCGCALFSVADADAADDDDDDDDDALDLDRVCSDCAARDAAAPPDEPKAP